MAGSHGSYVPVEEGVVGACLHVLTPSPPDHALCFVLTKLHPAKGGINKWTPPNVTTAPPPSLPHSPITGRSHLASLMCRSHAWVLGLLVQLPQLIDVNGCLETLDGISVMEQLWGKGGEGHSVHKYHSTFHAYTPTLPPTLAAPLHSLPWAIPCGPSGSVPSGHAA